MDNIHQNIVIFKCLKMYLVDYDWSTCIINYYNYFGSNYCYNSILQELNRLFCSDVRQLLHRFNKFLRLVDNWLVP